MHACTYSIWYVLAFEDEDHRQVGDAAAQVAPAAGGGVGEADDALRELLRAPHLPTDARWGERRWCARRRRRERAECVRWRVAPRGVEHLARDERGEAAADEEAADDEAGGVIDEHDADDKGAREEEAEGQALASAHHVAHGAHQQARDDGAGDGHDVGQVDVVLLEVQARLDVRNLRRGEATARWARPGPRQERGTAARQGGTANHGWGCNARGKTPNRTAGVRRLVLSGSSTRLGMAAVLAARDVGSNQRSLTSGAAAKVEKKVAKKPNHEAWKARMCGLEKLKIGMAVALCSASTGTEKRRPKMSVVPLLLTPFFSKTWCREAISFLVDCACACSSSTSSWSSELSLTLDITIQLPWKPSAVDTELCPETRGFSVTTVNCPISARYLCRLQAIHAELARLLAVSCLPPRAVVVRPSEGSSSSGCKEVRKPSRRFTSAATISPL